MPRSQSVPNLSDFPYVFVLFRDNKQVYSSMVYDEVLEIMDIQAKKLLQLYPLPEYSSWEEEFFDMVNKIDGIDVWMRSVNTLTSYPSKLAEFRIRAFH